MIQLGVDRATLARFVQDLVAEAQVASPTAAPDLRVYSAEEIDAARFGWATRLVDEYRSVVLFSDLLHLLADLEAPFAALCAVQRLIGDELRHTWLCAEVAGWLGGLADLSLDLGGLGAPRTGDPPGARALEIVAREIVVAETESIHVLRAYRDATEEPSIRQVLDSVLCDEVRHAATGRELVPLLEKTLPSEQISGLMARLPAVLVTDRGKLRAQYLANAVDGPGRRLGVSLRAEDLAMFAAA